MWRQLIHSTQDNTQIQDKLHEYFNGLGEILSYPERRASFAMYAMGLLSEGERKSVEPIAARAAGGNPELCQKYHDRMCHLLHGSRWDDQAVRRYAVNRALGEVTRHEPIEAWIVDDTGFLKQGDQSPGVQRQYTGSAGKVTPCQVAVSLTVATRTQHLPVDLDLFLPHSWADDPVGRAKAHIPADLTYRPKWLIALHLLDHALEAGIPPGIVTADAWYGTLGTFRGGVAARGLRYAVQVHATTQGMRISPAGETDGAPLSVLQLAPTLPSRQFRSMTWREGTRQPLRSRFARVRVRLLHPDPTEPPEQTLLIEWPQGESAPTHFTLSTLPPRTTLRELVRLTKQRWRTEQVYEEMKEELGLDHFEGRTYRGWQHHVSVVLVCYAFVLTALRQSFSPSVRHAGAPRTLPCSPRAPLRRLVRDRTARDRSCPPELAAPLPLLSSSHATEVVCSLAS